MFVQLPAQWEPSAPRAPVQHCSGNTGSRTEANVKDTQSSCTLTSQFLIQNLPQRKMNTAKKKKKSCALCICDIRNVQWMLQTKPLFLNEELEQWLARAEKEGRKPPKQHSLLGNCMAPRQHSAQLECNHHSDSERDRKRPSGPWKDNRVTPPALEGQRKDRSAPKTTAETGHWGGLLSEMLVALKKKLCRKKKLIPTAQRLPEMQCGKPSLPPLRRAACCSRAQLRYALPCAASEMRHFCHHHPDAEKLSLPTNWQRISVLIIILPCTSAWSTSQKQD